MWNPRRVRMGGLVCPTCSFVTAAKKSGGLWNAEKYPRSPPRFFVASSSDDAATKSENFSPRARRAKSDAINLRFASIIGGRVRRRGQKKMTGAESKRLGEIRRVRVIESPTFGGVYLDISGDLPRNPFPRAQIGSDRPANRSDRKTARSQTSSPRFFIPKLAAKQLDAARSTSAREIFLRPERSRDGVCNQQLENCLIVRAFILSAFVVGARSMARFGNGTPQIRLIDSFVPRQS